MERFRKTRTPWLTRKSTRLRTEWFFNKLINNLQLGIGSQESKPSTYPGGKLKFAWRAFTFIPVRYGIQSSKLHIWMASEILAPLLRSDLNASELLVEQFHVAEVFLHEIGVSSTQLPRTDDISTYMD